MTKQQVREDLMQIRYYYVNKDLMDRNMRKTGNVKFLEIVNKYNDAICHATPRNYSMYASLYIENGTQIGLAVEWGYTPEHIQYLHQGLISFFVKYFNEKEAQS